MQLSAFQEWPKFGPARSMLPKPFVPLRHYGNEYFPTVFVELFHGVEIHRQRDRYRVGMGVASFGALDHARAYILRG
jgi:hypothetical protein|tara:strand:+ start:243 stop:473 length:231 start_codon:yes stop_codon:yes gene_type:complete